MKRKKILSLILGLCMVLGMLILPVQEVAAVNASEVNQDVVDACNGILEVTQVITVDGVTVAYSRGTGFLIGTDENAQNVITNHHVVNAFPYEEKALKQLIQSAGLTLASDAKVKSEIRIVVKRDVYLTAEIVNQSEAGDFCILKMEQPIYDREPLTLGDSSGAATTQQIYALGFPAAVEGAWGQSVGESLQLDAVYTADDVTVTSGTISKVGYYIGTGAPISTMVHSATISPGNSGGPLVTADGVVMGINTYGLVEEDGYFYSTEINEVTDVLKALGIAYKEPSGPSVTETTETGEAPETNAETESETVSVNAEKLGQLQAVVDGAGSVALENMTAESAANFNTALKEAKVVLNSSAPSDEEIDEAIANLQTAQDGLVEEKGSNTMMIVGIAAAAIVVIIIIVVVVTSSGKKKKQQEEAERAAAMQRQQQQQRQQSAANSQQWNHQTQSQNMNHQQPQKPVDDGAGETSVLNEGAGETTVLGANIPGAVLIRKKNNERITITKAEFRIGKERRKVDYCISDNTNVSRTHANVVFKDGEFFIVDKNATNGTSVNGTSVAKGGERKLVNNDAIKLADEEFQFKML